MIYFVTKGNLVTGGPETLHQAACVFKKNGINVCMYYEQPHVLQTPNKYRKYNIAVADKIVDSKDNIIVVPETMTFVLKRFKHMTKVIWWLSVDFFESGKLSNWTNSAINYKKLPKAAFPAVALYRLIKTDFYYYHFEDSNKYFHFYNCEYARQYLLSHGVSQSHMRYLCGPLSDNFINNKTDIKEDRDNIILYNPKKGFEFTNKLILEAKKMNLNARFIPLKNMSEFEIQNIMKHSKIYIDFGDFPGPERIPRESVMMGCNIITSNQGAASYHQDVPIPDMLKYSKNDNNIINIINRLRDMLDNYDKYFHYYDEYRGKVRNQLKLFNEEINNISNILLKK